MQNNGKLVFFEGIDHVGKSTICELIFKDFVQQGIACSAYSFPGKQDGTLGKLVYDIHHDKEGIFAGNMEINSRNIDSLSLQIMHVAAHIDLLNSKIIPDIEAGKIVLLDRSWWSTFAYGIANGLSEDSLRDILQPELHILNGIPRNFVIYISRKEKEKDYSEEKTSMIIQTYEKLCTELHANDILKIENDGTIIDVVQKINDAIINF